MFSPKLLSTNKQKQIRKLKQKKFRNQSNSFIAEGFRLFDAAISSPNLITQEIIITEEFQKSKQGLKVKEEAKKHNITIFIADDQQMRSISNEVTPPGIVFIVNKEISKISLPAKIEEKIIIYLDRISDPGNLGTIMRSASWFGVNTIFLSPECVDPWNHKSVRASAGALFTLNLYTETDFTFIKTFKQNGYQFIATVVSDGIPLNEWDITSRSIIFLGQEASGLSKEILKHADVHISIPGDGHVESLNLSVAAGILLYEATNLLKNR